MGQITGINGITTVSGGITPKGILFVPDRAVVLSVIVANTGLVADANGKKILKAGAPLYGDIQNRAVAFVAATDAAAVVGDLVVPDGGGTVVLPAAATSNAVGCILHDTDVTAGNVNAQCVIDGFIDLNQVAADVVSAAAQNALKGKITFIK